MTPAEIANDLGCSAQTVRDWRRQAETDRGERGDVASDERERLETEHAGLRRHNQRLKQEEREVLTTAGHYAGHRRPPSPSSCINGDRCG